jgi:hypothetical protein
MGDILTALYDNFYVRPEMAELKRSVEANPALLRDKLPAEQRKIVLRIVDNLTMMAGEGALDSFLCGFKLAWQMANELNHYDDRRSASAIQAGSGACSILREGLEKEKASSSFLRHCAPLCGRRAARAEKCALQSK